jgi:hypothetical protein
MKPGLDQLKTLEDSSFNHPMEGPMIYMKSVKQRAFLRHVVKDLKEGCTEWNASTWGPNEENSTMSFRTIPFASEDGQELSFEGDITFQTPSWSKRCMPKSDISKYPEGVLLINYYQTSRSVGYKRFKN